MGRWASGHGLCCLAALLFCGCSLLDSWGGSHGPGADAHPGSQGDPHGQHGPLSPDHGPPMPPQPGMGEQIALVSERLAATEDDRKILAARLQQMQDLLIEKDRALIVVTREVQEATSQVAHTRAELQEWKREMAKLRDRAGSAEKDSKATLESVIRTLEQLLERDPAAIKGPEPLLPEVPRTP
jgi:hypothetical protein